jgi:hypothetical protein
MSWIFSIKQVPSWTILEDDLLTKRLMESRILQNAGTYRMFANFSIAFQVPKGMLWQAHLQMKKNA